MMFFIKKYKYMTAFVFLAFHHQVFAQSFPHTGEIIVKYKNKDFIKSANVVDLVERWKLGLIQTHLLAENPVELLKKLQADPNVEYAQFNHLLSERMAPNDLQFSEQWSLNDGNPGIIHAQQAWEISTGGDPERAVVVAVVDGGVDITHSDLKDNLWTNSGEIPGNGIDDDQNGYIDDIHGWNTYANNGDILPHIHGTHVAGIIGARGDNNQGITGVNWNVGIMGVSGSSVTTAIVIKSYAYVLEQKLLWLETSGKKGANVIATNSSFGVDYADCNSKDFPAWNDLYHQMGHAGILSVAATANLNIDIDQKGDVPTGCASPYLVTVTNTTKENAKYDSAGFGKIAVDLGAPGTNILSTLPENSYGIKTGTSMATPHVSGALALMMAAASEDFWEFYKHNPDQAALELKRVLLDTVQSNNSLKNTTVSGGILDLEKATKTISDWKNHF